MRLEQELKIRDNRWIRAFGFVPLTLYSVLSFISVKAVISNTVFRPHNLVFPMTDLIGWFGYLAFLTSIAGSGILAIWTAYYFRGVFKILYLSGSLAILSSMAYLPLSFLYNADVDFNPEISGQQFIVGTWMDNHNQLQLRADSSYVLDYKIRSIFLNDSSHFEGKWTLDRNRIHFSNLDPRWANPWEIRRSDGFYFITYSIPDNHDAWTGNLGLMRDFEWSR